MCITPANSWGYVGLGLRCFGGFCCWGFVVVWVGVARNPPKVKGAIISPHQQHSNNSITLEVLHANANNPHHYVGIPTHMDGLNSSLSYYPRRATHYVSIHCVATWSVALNNVGRLYQNANKIELVYKGLVL